MSKLKILQEFPVVLVLVAYIRLTILIITILNSGKKIFKSQLFEGILELLKAGRNWRGYGPCKRGRTWRETPIYPAFLPRSLLSHCGAGLGGVGVGGVGIGIGLKQKKADILC